MKIALKQHISCSPSDLFPWIDDPDKAMLWQKGVKETRILTQTKARVGTTFIERMEENGKSLTMSGEITNYSRNRLISLHLRSNIHEVDAEYSIYPDNHGSVLEVTSDIVWKFPMSIAVLFIGRKIKRNIFNQTRSELAELKRLCESGTPEK